MKNRIEVPIAQFSFTRKLDLMEMLWADMAGNETKLASPAWHAAILNDREAALNAGKVTVSSWEEAKERINKNVS
jgi:putative addiction module component (TIGR02574 family)